LRFADIIQTALGSLLQHKLRNTLTLFGVIIGTFVLVLSLSIGLGVHELVMHEFRKHDHLRKISVSPAYQAEEADVPAKELEVHGSMSDEKRERIRQALLRRWSGFNVRKPRVALTQDRLEALAAINHVQSVVPFVQRQTLVKLGDKEQFTWSSDATLTNKNLHDRLVAGEYFPSDDSRSVIVSEFLLYRLGVEDDDQVSQVLGQKIRVQPRAIGQPSGMQLLQIFSASRANVSSEENRVLEKAIHQLPNALEKLDLTDEERTVLRKALQKKPTESLPVKEPPISEEFTIVGVFREPTKEDAMAAADWGMELLWSEAEVVLPVRTAEALAFRSPFIVEHGVDAVSVTVDDERNLREVTREIEEMGLRQFSLIEVADNVHRNIVLVSIFTFFIAFVALLAAALGILNTMLMSILERTHEIGVMKALGARNRHIQFMFLVEGGLIGILGGLFGLLVSWLASFPGDSIARRLIEEQTRGRMEGSVFAFPLWLTVGVPLFACLVTTLAAVYPARRAAKVDPITALRHE
jgi:putative ABC transport system permease protein